MSILIYALILLGPRPTPNGVEFSIYAPYAESVYIAGDFNNWNTSQLPLKKDELGVWKRVIYLPPGRYEYKFIVDGEYVADPMNPTTAGAYGNSVIWVKEDGSISLTPPPSGNLPNNPNVFIHGDLRGFLNFNKNDEGGRLYSLQNTLYDAKLDIGSVIGGSNLWTRFRYNTTSGELGNIPVKLERLDVKLSKGVSFLRGFYNRFVTQFDDPLISVGCVNNYCDPYGRDEEGVLASTSLFLKDHLQVLYGRKPHGERDLMAARYKIFLGKLKLATTLRRRNRHQGNFDELYAFDGAVNGDLFRFGWELGLGSTFSDSSFEHSSRFVFVGAGIKSLNLHFAGQRNRYLDDLSVSFSELGTDYKLPSTPIGTFSFGLAMTNVSVSNPNNLSDSLVWMRLFDYYRVPRWQIPEYVLAGYSKRIARTVRYSVSKKLFLNWRFSVDYSGYASELMGKNIADQTIFQIEASKGRIGFMADIRNVNYRFVGFGTDSSVNVMSFSDRYFELSYAFNAFVALKFSWGYNPIDLNDEYIARESFLMDHGLTSAATRSAYLRLPFVVQAAEQALEETNSRFSIWTVVKF